MIRENRPKERGKGEGVAFVIKDTILFQEIEFKTSDKHLEVQAIELTTAGNNITLVKIQHKSN